MKIKTQGLLLVFVPFATTFLFCGTMLAAEIRAQIELSRQAEFRELMVELNALPYHFMLVGSALISWKMSHRDFDLKKSEQQCEQIVKIVSQLRRQALHLRKERKELNAGNLEKLADEAEKVLGEINRYRNNITDSERVPGSFNRHTFAVAMENSIDSMFSTIKTLSAQEYLQDTTARARYEKLFQAQIGLVFLSLSISFGLAFLAAYILSRKLVGKIRTVEDNFRRLEENRELLPALTGDDELSNLDRTFHEMACKLSQAEEEKRKGRLLFSARLRLPIDRLSSDLSLMLRGVLMEPNELGRTRLTAAISNLAKLNTLIDELLNINNLGVQSNLVLNMVPCRPDRIIEGAVQCVEVFAERENHKLINKASEATASKLSVLADASKIEQVLINLISNSCKYSEPGGSIEIRCEQQGSRVRLAVKDSGNGLSAEQCLRVFEKYEQANTEDSNKGIGLGLPICKKIVEEHGGTIGVISEAGKGCLFWFELPILS